MDILQFAFGYFAVVIVACALMVVISRNPVHSALFMLPLFFHVAGIFIMLNAEFVAALQVLVYAGAIMVLFLFVIMLIKSDVEKVRFHLNTKAALPLAVTVGGFIMSVVVRSAFTGAKGTSTVEAVQQAGNSQMIGQAMFSEFLMPFEVTSVILLVAMVGTIVLAKKKID
jgi:NADH-quinone oxidoreductase subunit J